MRKSGLHGLVERDGKGSRRARCGCRGVARTMKSNNEQVYGDEATEEKDAGKKIRFYWGYLQVMMFAFTLALAKFEKKVSRE